MFASLVPSSLNKLLTTCNKLDGTIRLASYKVVPTRLLSLKMLEEKLGLYIITFGTFSGLKYLLFARTIARRRLQSGSRKIANIFATGLYQRCSDNLVTCLIFP